MYTLSRHFSLRSQNNEYPRIFQVTGANQNARKLLSTDLVNTKYIWLDLQKATSQCWDNYYDLASSDGEQKACS